MSPFAPVSSSRISLPCIAESCGKSIVRTGWPVARSRSISIRVCVCFPAPSPPSMTKTRPGSALGRTNASTASSAAASSAYSTVVSSGCAPAASIPGTGSPRGTRQSAGTRALCSA